MNNLEEFWKWRWEKPRLNHEVTVKMMMLGLLTQADDRPEPTPSYARYPRISIPIETGNWK